MNLFHAVILSIVEGITEFLPVSSTAHLFLVSNFLGLSQSDFVKTFEISIQSGAILAAVIFYRKQIFTRRDLVLKAIAGFIPSAFIGLVFYKFIKQVLIGNLWITLVAMFTGGLVLLFIKQKKANSSVISYRMAAIIGLFQSLAVIPGVSRSGAAIVGGLVLGLSQSSSTEFSFLLAIPTLFAATSLDLFKSASQLTQANWPLLFVGFIGSALTAILAIKLFTNFVSKHSLRLFGVYRIVLTLDFLIFQFIQG